VKAIQILSLIGCIILCKPSSAQELDRSTTISLFTGAINYQGDVNPNSFTLKHSNLAAGIIIRKPLNRWFTLRAGANIGKIEAADQWNRDYLKSRNLSFTTSIKEAYIGLEVSVLDMSIGRFTPYLYGGIAVFHFNPGQAPYKLTQLCLPFGGGAKYSINDGLSVGIEFSQRKSFTDYIDDVSTHFIDGAVLMQEKGLKAVEMAYRADELPGGRTIFPSHGDQRGTPSEMDWYYFLGMTIEMKLNKVGELFNFRKGVASQRCPRVNY
jgi:hypothetical protein